jgi:hypothetical protein
MDNQAILLKIQALPENMKKEALDYIEFLLQKYQSAQKVKKTPKLGSGKGIFKMADDFDAPLSDFKDYM